MNIVKWSGFIIFALLVFLFSGARAYSYEFAKGERLTYSARFLYVVPVGNVTIEIKDIMIRKGKKVLLIEAEAKTAKWISLFFKAEAILRSYVDREKLYPYEFEQVLKVAGKPDDIRRAAYDRAANIMEAEGKGRKKVPQDVRDPISAIYYLRAQDLRAGMEIKQVINNNQSNYIFDTKVSGKKKISGVDCWVLNAKIRRENKSMYHSMDVDIYITDDSRRVPVVANAKTKVGPVTLVLKNN